MLILSPEAGGLGLGGKLTDECIAFVRAKDYKKRVPWTYPDMLAAGSIYDKRRFMLIKSEPYQGFGIDLVRET